MTLRPEVIDGFSLEEATDWLDERSISYDLLETHGEILDLIRATLKTGITTGRQFVNSDEMMSDCLTKDDEMKSELLNLYNDLRLFVEQDLEDELKTVINNIYSDIDTRLERNKDDLINSDCAIVVAGETSAGKSSFLNLLLGTDVLPQSLLANTSAICQIHKNDHKWFKVVRENGESQIFTIEGEGPKAEEELFKTLSQYIGRSGLDNVNCIRHVDIYWPVPMLKEGVTLVDTPGTGENPEMTEKLAKYLPNAVAFIYIVNSANAGGIQEDTILHIISEQKKLDTDQELSGFDPASMIFVCNKWDIVESRGSADDTWRDTVRRLQMTIPGLNEDHIFKLSVTEATRYRRSGIGNTPMYQHLLEGLEKLIPGSLIAHIKRHYRWIYSLLSKLEVSVASRVSNARKTSDEKDMFLREVTARLLKLEMDSETVRTRLIEVARQECRFITEELHTYLSREDIRSVLQTWTEEEAPDIIGNDLDVTKLQAEAMILKRLLNVIQTWEDETRIVQNASQKLTRIFNAKCLFLSRECKDVDEMMKSSISDGLDLFFGRQSENADISLGLEASEIAILVASFPIWVPLGIVALAIFFPIGLGAAVVERIQQALERKKYRKDKATYMERWTLMLLDRLQEVENLSSLIDRMYLKSMLDRIDHLCREVIPKQIKADKAQLRNIVTDRRTASQIIHQFQPKKKMLKGMFQKLYLFDLRYLADDVIGISKILRYKQIGSGSFSDVYHATWRKANCDKKEVALKILKGHDIYLQLSELDCSRRLKHQNIVEFYGVIFAERERYRSDGAGARAQAQDIGLPLYDDRLMLVLELCDQSLESLVFGTIEKQCGSFPNNLRGRKTHQFFFEMAVSVCEGLAYMHRMKFLHRDLKLSNVLVKDGVGKLGDLGFARAEVAITGTAVGTLTHMAPELLRDKMYSFRSDVYSLGILLWELWYGKRSYSDAQYGNLGVGQFINAVTRGKRPNCYTEHTMFPDLKNLVEKCWDNDPNGRPNVGEVKTELMQIDVKHRKNISR